MQIRVQLSERSKEIVRRMKEPEQWLLDAVCQGFDAANLRVVGHIQKTRLSGVGPFPPNEHKLGIVSQHLRSSLYPSQTTAGSSGKAYKDGLIVRSMIGDPVKYAALHEFGGVVTRKAHKSSVRLATNKAGETIGRFAKKKSKRQVVRQVKIGEHQATYPARAPIITGIRESNEIYLKEIPHAINLAVQAMMSSVSV
jgi:phage gpG-like protein